MPNIMVKEIVASGHSGAEKAALDVAKVRGLAVNGWCSHTSDESVESADEEVYHLKHTASASEAVCSLRNIHHSDATLVLSMGGMVDRARREMVFAEESHKPVLNVDLNRFLETQNISDWLAENNVRALHIVGPSEDEYPGVYERSRQLLLKLFH